MSNLERYEAKREELIEDRVYDLMQGKTADKLDNFSPLLAENIAEYMAEAPAGDVQEMLEWMREYRYDRNLDHLQSLGLAFLVNCRAYWERLATERAERETPSATELMHDDEVEAAEMRYQAARDNGDYRAR